MSKEDYFKDAEKNESKFHMKDDSKKEKETKDGYNEMGEEKETKSKQKKERKEEFEGSHKEIKKEMARKMLIKKEKENKRK